VLLAGFLACYNASLVTHSPAALLPPSRIARL
jgi:hypothetical protein